MRDKDEDLLFVYGTLLELLNEHGDYLRKNSTFVAKGQMKGALYDEGDYPCAVHDPGSSEWVYGSIYRIHHPVNTFRVLDLYEGLGTEDTAQEEFIRCIADISTSFAILKCWVYLYNLPLLNLIRIESGDYLKYKNPLNDHSGDPKLTDNF